MESNAWDKFESSTFHKFVTTSWGFSCRQSADVGDVQAQLANVDELLHNVVYAVPNVKPEIFRIPKIIRRFEDHYDPKLLFIGLYGRERRMDQDHKEMEDFKWNVRNALLRVLKKEGRRKPRTSQNQMFSGEEDDASAERGPNLSEKIWSELMGKVIPEVHQGGEKILAVYDDIDVPVGVDIIAADTAQRARDLLMLDGVFLICFLIFLASEDGDDSTAVSPDERFDKFLPILHEFRRAKLVAYQEQLISDMWLFENQVPFVVMRKVLEAIHFELVGEDDERRVTWGLRRLIKKAIDTVTHLLPGDFTTEKMNVREIERRLDSLPLEKCRHLLECLYRVVCPNVLDTPDSRAQQATTQSSRHAGQSHEFECLFGPAEQVPAKAQHRNAAAIASGHGRQIGSERPNCTCEAHHESTEAKQNEPEEEKTESISSTTNAEDTETGSVRDMNDREVLHTTLQTAENATFIHVKRLRPWKLLATISAAFRRASRNRADVGILNAVVPRPHPSFTVASQLVPVSAPLGTQVGASVIDIGAQSGVRAYPLPTLDRVLPVCPQPSPDIVAAPVSAFQTGDLSVPEPSGAHEGAILQHAQRPAYEDHVPNHERPSPVPYHSHEIEVIEESRGTSHTQPSLVVHNQSHEEIAVLGNGFSSQVTLQPRQSPGADFVGREYLVVFSQNEIVDVEGGFQSVVLRQSRPSANGNIMVGRQDLENQANETVVAENDGLVSQGITRPHLNEFENVEVPGKPEIQEADTDLFEIEISEHFMSSREMRVSEDIRVGQDHHIHEEVRSPEASGDTLSKNLSNVSKRIDVAEAPREKQSKLSFFPSGKSSEPISKRAGWFPTWRLGIVHNIQRSFVILVAVIHRMFTMMDSDLRREFEDSWFEFEGAAAEQDIPYATPVKRLPRSHDCAFDDSERHFQARQPRSTYWRLNRSLDPELPTASELRKAGIRVEADSEPGCGVRFSNSCRPVLHVSQLRIEQNTETLLRNLVAFECQFTANHASHEHLLMTYLAIFKELTNTEEDVRCLKSGIKPVIPRSNFGTDGMVADMFKRMTDHGCLADNDLRDLRQRVNSCSRSHIRRGCTEFLEIQCNCRKPWIVIFLLAGAFILLLTAVQTTLALLDYF